MEGDDVDDHRRDERKGERHEAVRQQQNGRHHLGSLDQREHIPRREERAEERASGGWRGGHGKEMQESVQTKDQKRHALNHSSTGGDCS